MSLNLLTDLNVSLLQHLVIISFIYTGRVSPDSGEQVKRPIRRSTAMLSYCLLREEEMFHPPLSRLKQGPWNMTVQSVCGLQTHSSKNPDSDTGPHLVKEAEAGQTSWNLQQHSVIGWDTCQSTQAHPQTNSAFFTGTARHFGKFSLSGRELEVQTIDSTLISVC